MKAILITGYPEVGKSSIIRALTGADFSYGRIKLYYMYNSRGNVIKVCAIQAGAYEYPICPDCYYNLINDLIDSQGDFDLFVNALDVLKRGGYNRQSCKSCGNSFSGHPCNYLEKLILLGFRDIDIFLLNDIRQVIKTCLNSLSGKKAVKINLFDINTHNIVSINNTLRFDPYQVAQYIRRLSWP